MNIFFDLEFTGLHRNTTPISIGLVSASGETFYGVFNDFDTTQVDEWVKDNVIIPLFNPVKHFSSDAKERLIINGYHNNKNEAIADRGSLYVTGDKEFIRNSVIGWLDTWNHGNINDVQFIGDCVSYDWILITELLATYHDGYPVFPKGTSYIPFDICTYMILKGVDPDISRESFMGKFIKGEKHNSLYDAKVIKECYLKLNLI